MDQKIISQYGLGLTKKARLRRKQAGLVNVQYLRYGRFFVLLATHGRPLLLATEANQIRDIRQHPLHFMGYSIGGRQSGKRKLERVSVRIRRDLYSELKARLEALALQLPVEELLRELRGIGYEPFAPVRAQLRAILHAVNRKRKETGLELVPRQALYLRRFPVRPFG